jgi:hypothetical protein
VLPYYSKRRERIHIQTDHSIDLIDEIAYYEQKATRDGRRREKKEVVNPAVIEDTNSLIEAYIKLMEVNDDDDEEQRESHDDAILQTSIPSDHNSERRQIRNVLSREMHDLLDEV